MMIGGTCVAVLPLLHNHCLHKSRHASTELKWIVLQASKESMNEWKNEVMNEGMNNVISFFLIHSFNDPIGFRLFSHDGYSSLAWNLVILSAGLLHFYKRVHLSVRRSV